MIPFFLRFWIHPSGKLSLRAYRIFLLTYIFIFIPVTGVSFLAFLWLGVRQPEGILQDETPTKVIILSCTYFVFCYWPLMVASLKRMHDLGYRGRDYFFSFNPIKSFKVGREMLSRPGSSADEDLTRY